MERANFVRGSTGAGRCRAICRFLIQLGADFLGLPEEEESAEVRWWEEPTEWSYDTVHTGDRSRMRMEAHWVDEDLFSGAPWWTTVSSAAHGAIPDASTKRQEFFEEVESVKKEKETFWKNDRKNYGQFGIARFLKLGGAISGGGRDQRRLVFSNSRESFPIPLIKTDGSLRADYP